MLTPKTPLPADVFLSTIFIASLLKLCDRVEGFGCRPVATRATRTGADICNQWYADAVKIVLHDPSQQVRQASFLCISTFDH